MPKSEGQKLKLLYLADLLRRETDEDHALSMSDILSRLEELGVHAERKSIYDDLRALEDYGMDIIASRWEAQSLQRQVYAVGRVKSMNESIYYSIDTIHTAISQDRQIAFRYFEWTMEKTVRYRRDGQLYERSPYALVWDDENYYLVAYDHTASPPGIRHYRVDKMANLSVLEESRLGKATFDGFDMAQYAKQMFGMFGGAQQDVELRFAARLAGVVLDRFGKEVTLLPDGGSFFRVHVQAVVSPQFMGWVAGFGTDAKLLGPPAVVREYTAFCREMLAQYE